MPTLSASRDTLFDSLSEGLGVRRSEVDGLISDPAYVGKALAELPAASLGLLEIVADAGGRLAALPFLQLARERLGLDEATTRQAFAAISRAGLGCYASVKARYGGGVHEFVALLEVNAWVVARAVLGLTLPTETPPVAPDQNARLHAAQQRRDEVAILAATAHRPVRRNQDGSLNATDTRKFSDAIGPAVGAATVLARAGGALRARDRMLVPSLEGLRQVAREGLPSDSEETRTLHAWLAGRGWVSVEALARVMVAARLELLTLSDWSEHELLRAGGPVDLTEARKSLHRATSLQFTMYRNHEFVRAGDEPAEPVADAHVTPSFEILLGPQTDPALVAVIALGAEPVRFDRVLTLKLTAASVSNATALGVSAELLLEALAAACKHPIPETIKRMIAEWAVKARTATLRQAWVIECANTESADAAARALGSNLLARPTPLLLLARASLSNPVAMLAKAGVRTASRGDEDPLEDAAELELTRPAVPPPPYGLDAQPSAAARARFEAVRATGLAQSVPLPAAARAEKTPTAFAPLVTLTELRRVVAKPVLLGAIDLLAIAWERSRAQFEQWRARLPAAEQARTLERAARTPGAFASYLALTSSMRDKTARASRTSEELLALALRHASHADRVDPAGRQLIGLCSSGLVRDGLPGLFDASIPLPTVLDAKPARTRPELDQIPPAPPSLAARVFRDSIGQPAPLWLHVRILGESRVVGIIPEAVHERGKSIALLGVDAETEERVSFPIETVVGVAR